MMVGGVWNMGPQVPPLQPNFLPAIVRGLGEGGQASGTRCSGGSVSAPGIFFDPCPTGDLLRGTLSAVCAQCNYLDV